MSVNCVERAVQNTTNFYTYFVGKYRAMIFDEKNLRFTSQDLKPWHFYYFAVSQSRFGRSLIAIRNIAKGEKIACLPAIFLTDKVESISIDFDGQVHDIDLEEHLYNLISAENTLWQFSHLSTFLDHACWPECNAACDGHTWREGILSYTLTALRNIKSGEAVSVDYATIEYAAEGAAQLDCACNSASCRKRYTGFVGMPAALQREFIQQHVLEAPVAYEIWKTLNPEEAVSFVQAYRAGRPTGDGDLLADLCMQNSKPDIIPASGLFKIQEAHPA